MKFLSEFVRYLKSHKKFWLTPILLAVLLFGGLVMLTDGPAVAPFIYALF
jgi:hypothetical protein